MIDWEKILDKHYIGWLPDGMNFHLGEFQDKWTLVIPGIFWREGKSHDTERFDTLEEAQSFAEEMSKNYKPTLRMKNEPRSLRNSVTGKKSW